MSKQKLISFNLLPETFTMKDVEELYETVYDRPFKILDLNVLKVREEGDGDGESGAVFV